jgi:hypothetical protein
VTAGPGEARRVMATDAVGEVVRRSEILVATFNDRTAVCYLAPERYLNLGRSRPTLDVHTVAGGVVISTDNLARQVMLEIPGATGAVFDDNAFDLLPGQSRTIKVIHPAGSQRVRVSAVLAAPVTVDDAVGRFLHEPVHVQTPSGCSSMTGR